MDLIKRVLFSGAAVLICTLAAGSAHAACYKDIPNEPRLSCAGGYSGNSADFAGSCTYVTPPPTRVEIPCPGRWVNTVNASVSHAQACSAAGLSPSSVQSQWCAAGERRPTVGDAFSSISYRYGKWGGSTTGGTSTTTRDGQYYCWMPGQKKDYDRTDLVVAYFCE